MLADIHHVCGCMEEGLLELIVAGTFFIKVGH